MSVRVQFVLTDKEYEELKKIVDERGISISKYVKDRVFQQDDSFEKIWNEFLDKLNAFPKGIEFDVSIVMTQRRWQELDRSNKLSVARLFNRKVSNNELPNIVFKGRSASNVSVYEKTA